MIHASHFGSILSLGSTSNVAIIWRYSILFTRGTSTMPDSLAVFLSQDVSQTHRSAICFYDALHVH